MLLTGSTDLANVLFVLLFLPGILLHEVIHFLIAKILRAPTKKFSIIPQSLTDGRLRLGYVETVKTDLLQETLIGISLLLSGILFIAYVGMVQFGFTETWRFSQASAQLPLKLTRLSWFRSGLLVLAVDVLIIVSSTRLPSPSGRQS